MDWTQVLTIVGSNIALIMIVFGTTITIWIHMDSKTESNLKAIREDMKNFHQAMQIETKDFHGRLIAIEERNKNKD